MALTLGTIGRLCSVSVPLEGYGMIVALPFGAVGRLWFVIVALGLVRLEGFGL